MSHRRVERICSECNKTFYPRVEQIERGVGKYCSKSCAALNQPRDSLETRLWSKVDNSGGSGTCWPWLGTKDPCGYGTIASGKSRKTLGTHRAAYASTYGEIPEGLWVLHRCDNPACCNPEHLFLGTQAENIQDMMQKKRHVSPGGERAGNAKLTQIQVDEIRSRIKGIRGEHTQLAKEYNVHKRTIGSIVKGKTWRGKVSI